MASRIGNAVLAGLLLSLVGCAQPLHVDPTRGATFKSSGAAAGAVTFSVALDPSLFSEQEPINVTLWDQEQLAIKAQTAECSVSYDVSTGREETSCPPGVTYRQSTPEEWTFTRAELAAGLTIPSKTVMVGERFRLSVGGTATDGCNTAVGSVEGLTTGARVAIQDMAFHTTELGCLSAGDAPR